MDGLRRGYIHTPHGVAGLYLLRILLEDKEMRQLLSSKLSVHDIMGSYRLAHFSVERILDSGSTLGHGAMLVTKTDEFSTCN